MTRLERHSPADLEEGQDLTSLGSHMQFICSAFNLFPRIGIIILPEARYIVDETRRLKEDNEFPAHLGIEFRHGFERAPGYNTGVGLFEKYREDGL